MPAQRSLPGAGGGADRAALACGNHFWQGPADPGRCRRCPVVYVRPPLPPQRLGEGIHLYPDSDRGDVDGSRRLRKQRAKFFGGANAMALRGFYGVERAGLREKGDPNCTSALTARARGSSLKQGLVSMTRYLPAKQ